MTAAALQILSIARKAGKLAFSDGPCLDGIRGGTAVLTVLAKDASPNTRKRFTDKSRSYGVPLVEFADKTSLGEALGKKEIAVAIVTDEGLKTLFLSKL